MGAPGAAWCKPGWCPNAGTAVERLICSDQDLSALDVRMTKLYWQVKRANPSSANVVTAQQRNWLKTRDACGARSGCLVRRYRERIQELEAASRGSSSAVSESTWKAAYKARQDEYYDVPDSYQEFKRGVKICRGLFGKSASVPCLADCSVRIAFRDAYNMDHPERAMPVESRVQAELAGKVCPRK